MIDEADASRPVASFLARFADDFNAHRVERMAAYYTDTFSAVVDGLFVTREAYLEVVAALLAAAPGDIRFDLNSCRVVGGSHVLADGITTVRGNDGAEQASLFSILCVGASDDLKFDYVHSSTSRRADAGVFA